MGRYLAYRMVRQTETELEYAYGPTQDQLDSRLLLDPTDPQALPISGADEGTDGWLVAGKILRMRNVEGSWPTVGLIQS